MCDLKRYPGAMLSRRARVSRGISRRSLQQQPVPFNGSSFDSVLERFNPREGVVLRIGNAP